MRPVRAISRKGSGDQATRQRPRILRDYTPDAIGSDRDDIVRSSWRHEERGRNVRALERDLGVTETNGPKVEKLASLSKTRPYAGNSSHSRSVLVRSPRTVKIRRTWGQSAGKALSAQGTLRDFTSGICAPKQRSR